MEIFELGEVAKILGMPSSKVKNWTIGRPLKIEASVRPASGHGSRNLFGREDVYLMALANELSKAGMAAKAIGKVLEAVRVKYPNGLKTVEALFVARGPRLACRIENRQDRFPADAVVRIVVDVQGMRERVDREVDRLS